MRAGLWRGCLQNLPEGYARRGSEKTAFYETHLLFANQMVHGRGKVFLHGIQRTVVRIAFPITITGLCIDLRREQPVSLIALCWRDPASMRGHITLEAFC